MPLLTFLDRRASERVAHFEFGGPATFSGRVPSADSEINIVNGSDNYAGGSDVPPWHTDYPFLAEGVRILHWFRREDSPLGMWVPRFAGFVNLLDDLGNTEFGRSSFTAYDPWQYLFARPVYRVECLDRDCATVQDYTLAQDALPGPEGVIFLEGTPINEVATEILRRTIELDGPCGIDAGTAWGGTGDYGGQIATLDLLTENLVFQQGTTVGEAWQILMEQGDIEIVLRPIYDPDARPGYLCELDIFGPGDAGNYPPGTYPLNQPSFSWDRSGHDLVILGRELDGKERANQIQFYIGGPAGGKVPVQLQTSLESSNRFGKSWNVETRLRTLTGESVFKQAQLAIGQRQAGYITWDLSPTPEWTFRPFEDYHVGSYVGVYHSSRLRQEEIDFPRVRSFDFNLSDEGVESVSNLEVWVDV